MSDNEGEPAHGENEARIDQIDEQLQALIVERVNLMPGGHWPERDAAVLKKLSSRNKGPLPARSLEQIFKEILSAGQALHAPVSVAYLGPEGTYSHAATARHFGHAADAQPQSGFAEIFHAVETGRCEYAVVPVENSTEGSINHTLDLMMQSPLKICGEIRLRIQHQLLSQETELAAIESVHAHPQSLAQCRGWLDQYLPYATRVSESSNAKAAELAQGKAGLAAIAGYARCSSLRRRCNLLADERSQPAWRATSLARTL